jgi:tRNA-Thr(GGU) m(6)t(6)A37 methyltransferase TsaA
LRSDAAKNPGVFAENLRRYNVRIWIRIIVDAQNVDNVASMNSYTLEPVGFIRSTVKSRHDAPRQGPEGAPDAWLEIQPQFAEALLGMEVGHELIVITWLHDAKRDVLKGHPRSDESRPLTGVFYTRSPARPNPLGLHPVTVRAIEGKRLKIGPIEAFDGTPVVDIKSASTRADG